MMCAKGWEQYITYYFYQCTQCLHKLTFALVLQKSFYAKFCVLRIAYCVFPYIGFISLDYSQQLNSLSRDHKLQDGVVRFFWSLHHRFYSKSADFFLNPPPASLSDLTTNKYEREQLKKRFHSIILYYEHPRCLRNRLRMARTNRRM